MSASSDKPGLFPELICGRCRIYGNKERYEYNNIKFLYFVWDCYSTPLEEGKTWDLWENRKNLTSSESEPGVTQ